MRSSLIIATLLLLITIPTNDAVYGVPEHYSCEGTQGLTCTFPEDCLIASDVRVNCTTRRICPNPVTKVNIEAICLFCWQLPESDYDCEPATNCSTSSAYRPMTKCVVHDRVICMGQRKFLKRVRCNWSSGHSWSKAMFLSVVLGGFGADRFYLGHWKSAIGKMFSFGGLGVWTIVDVVLIAVGYLKPYDGSLYL